MPIKESFSKRLAKIRKAKSLSQYDLAKITGFSQRMIAHYETKSKSPAPDIIMRLAKALNVSADELIGYKPVKIKQPLNNNKLAKKMKILEQLPAEDQKTVTTLIDNLYRRNKK